MPIEVSAKLRGDERYVRALGQLDPGSSPGVRAGFIKAALLVQSIAATQTIVRGRGPTAAPLPDRLSGRTGALARSIAVDTTRLPREIAVGTELVYGAVHELGGRVHPKRPFLAPAVVIAGPRIEQLIGLGWESGIEKGRS